MAYWFGAYALTATQFQFSSPVHASLVSYWFRFNDGTNIVDNNDEFLIGSVTYSDGLVTMDTDDMNKTGLTPSTTYSIEVRTEQLIGEATVYGPWSDTGADYTA